MGVATQAIETAGIIDANCQLVLDDPLSLAGPKRVRVIILIPDETEIDEAEWLRAAATSPAFDFLKDPAEDIYSVQDGKPLAPTRQARLVRGLLDRARFFRSTS